MEVAKNLNKWENDIEKGKMHKGIGEIYIGRALENINKGNMWIQTGCKTFVEYVEKTHGYKKSMAYQMIDTWRNWGEDIIKNPEFQKVIMTRLYQALSVVNDSNRLEILHDAVFIPDKQGWENQLRNRKGEVGTDDEHEHDWQPVNIEQCSICKLRRKVKP